MRIGLGAGEGESLMLAIAGEMIVDELCSVVGVQTEKGKGEALSDLKKSSKHMDLRLVSHRSGLCPAGMVSLPVE